MRNLALKKLKSSDLSFFKSYLDKHPQAKQKGFNLDVRVMEGEFFPNLKELLFPREKKAAHVDLMIFGPGLADAQTLARKVKLDAKNIRLNGEYVFAPIEQPDRYEVMAPDDFAVMEFSGVPLPSAVKVVLIAANHMEDQALHRELSALLPGKNDSMKVLQEAELAKLVSDAAPSPEHPIRDWLDSGLLEEVGFGDSRAVEKLNRRRPGRGISLSDLKASKESAERTGMLGEEFMNAFLEAGGIPWVSAHEWTSMVNAISPFDFLLTVDGADHHADAKSTSGKFENPIYLSIAELRHAVESGVPYHLFRFYSVSGESASLRIARDVGNALKSVLDALKTLPDGASVDSLSLAPSFFTFDADIYELAGTGEEDDSGE